MKCKDCECCRFGYEKHRPNDYVCTGVKHPFVIADINTECTEYPDRASAQPNERPDSYHMIINNLNAAKWELKRRNDPTLNACIKYIKDAIFETGRLGAKYANLSAEHDIAQFFSGMRKIEVEVYE